VDREMRRSNGTQSTKRKGKKVYVNLQGIIPSWKQRKSAISERVYKKAEARAMMVIMIMVMKIKGKERSNNKKLKRR
jgi:hypothetical protein